MGVEQIYAHWDLVFKECKMEPKKIGGVEIYAPIKNQKETVQKNGEKLYEVTVDNGSKDGIRLEYTEQFGRNVGGQNLPPVVYFNENQHELSLRNLDKATIFGSEADDKIVSTSTNSVFKFKGGGFDIIEQKTTSGESPHNNKIYIDEGEYFIESKNVTRKETADDYDDDNFWNPEPPYRKETCYEGTDSDKPELNEVYEVIEEQY